MAYKAFGQSDQNSTIYDKTIIHDSDGVRLRRIDDNIYSTLLGTGNGSISIFSGTLSIKDIPGDIREGSILVYSDVGVAYDDGMGGFSASFLGSPCSVNYETGDITITYVIPPTSDVFVSFKTYKAGYLYANGIYLKGDIIFPNWQGTSIVELFGFVGQEENVPNSTVIGEDSSGTDILQNTLDSNNKITFSTSVGYQLSTDGGITWQYYGTGGWLVGNNTDLTFSSWKDIDIGISTLSFDSSSGKKQLRVKARLFPSENGVATPILKAIYVFHELFFDLEEDFQRSIKRFLDSTLKVRELITFANQSGVSSVTLKVSEGEEDSLGNISYSANNLKVYNLTSDPGRTTSIPATLSGKIVTFLSPQTGNIEIQVLSSIPVFVGRADDRFILSTSRAVVVILQSIAETEYFNGEARGSSSSYFEPVFSQRKIRRRSWPNFIGINVTIMGQSSKERGASSIGASLRKLFDENLKFQSVATGNTYAVTSTTMGMDSIELKLGLAARRLSTMFTFYAHEQGYTEEFMAEKFNFRMVQSDSNTLTSVSKKTVNTFGTVEDLIIEAENE